MKVICTLNPRAKSVCVAYSYSFFPWSTRSNLLEGSERVLKSTCDLKGKSKSQLERLSKKVRRVKVKSAIIMNIIPLNDCVERYLRSSSTSSHLGSTERDWKEGRDAVSVIFCTRDRWERLYETRKPIRWDVIFSVISFLLTSNWSWVS